MAANNFYSCGFSLPANQPVMEFSPASFCPRLWLAIPVNDHDWDIWEMFGRHISDYAHFRPSIKQTNTGLKGMNKPRVVYLKDVAKNTRVLTRS
jgi:hypothetical protein